MEGQTREALENLKKALESVNASFDNIVSANRFVTDLDEMPTMRLCLLMRMAVVINGRLRFR